MPRHRYFYYEAPSERDLYLDKEIEDIARHWRRDYEFGFIPVLSDEPSSSNWLVRTGSVADIAAAEPLTTANFDWSTATYFLCRSPRMPGVGNALLAAHGLSRAQCRFDKFEVASSPAPRIDNQRCVLREECLLVKPIADCIVEGAAPPRVKRNLSPMRPAQTSDLYDNSLVIDEKQCIRCQARLDACPHDAIVLDDASPLYECLRHGSG